MILEHTDSDGDNIKIDTVGSDDPAGSVWHVSTSSEAGAYLDQSAVERLAHAAFRHIGTTATTRVVPEPAPVEVGYPDDGRRVAALKAASEALPNARSTFLVEVAKWILGETEPGS